MRRHILAFALLALPATAHAAPDAARGKILFLRCSACHSLDGTNKVGPTLKGVYGRKAASLPSYIYSPAMKASAVTWDAAALDKWLQRPNAVVPGTKMAFAGLPSADDRAALIAYLKAAK